jgi:phospholipase C
MSSESTGSPIRTPLDASHPFPGLRPYEETDTTWFFGRGQEINDLLKRLRRVRFLAVVGPSGFGKSSLVKAGLLPAVRDGYLDASWRIAKLTPGNHPLDNLAAAFSLALSCDARELRSQLDRGPIGLAETIQSNGLPSETNLLVVVDQFEELFQFVQRKGEPAQDEAKAFLRLLLTLAASNTVPLYIVITMRLEWLSECATYLGLSEAINEGIYLVPQMSRRQFQQATLGPIEAAKGSITTMLLDRMLNDLDGRTDQLPVLQHALMRMWQRHKRGEPLDVASYEEIGTLSSSLSKHAEEIYSGLGQEGQKAAEALFRAITQVIKNRRLRKPMPLGEIVDTTGAPIDQLKKVVEAFAKEGRSFLVTSAVTLDRDSIIDISHEALIRQWSTLSKWVDDEAEIFSRVNRLEEIATEWDRGRRTNSALLYRGPVLKKAQELRPRLKADSICAAFLRASRKTERWSHILWRGSTAILLGCLAILAFYYQRNRNLLAARNAEHQQVAQALKGLQQEGQEAQQSLLSVRVPSVAIQSKLVFLQYPGKQQLELAEVVQSYLDDQGYVVPDLEQVGSKAPRETQVRYFYDLDKGDAEKLANVLKSSVAGNVKSQLTSTQQNPAPKGQLEIWLSPSAKQAPRISVKHLVVLMLEGRSFDHMLGFLKSSTYAIDGLSGNESNPDSQGTRVPVSNDAAAFGDLTPDPGHSFPDVNFQIFGNLEGYPNGPPMQGFVKSYEFHTQQTASAHRIMKCMRETSVPALSALAKGYAICDHWFASVPGPTFPNRAFVHAATSVGRVDMSPVGYVGIPKTVYELLQERGVTARIYYSDSTLALTFPKLAAKMKVFFGSIQDFLDACKNGNLPSYSFIEPRYASHEEAGGAFAPANDQHPDHDIAAGEQLIRDVYQALRSNKEIWENSLLVITYSQHGGLYDHVSPPTTVSPDGLVVQDPGQGVAKIAPFDFTRLGVRVPAVIISPYIEPLTTDHTVYDHTSIIATARKLFLGKAAAANYLTQRDRQANTFDHLLTRTTPRSDNPIH